MKKTSLHWSRAAALALVVVSSHAVLAPAVARGGAPAARAAERGAVDMRAIRQRAGSMPVDARIDMDKRIAATIERVNARAAAQSSTAVAARAAAEFSMTSEAILEEKGTHGWSWGEVLVAHTLLANSTQGLAATDLAGLREDGFGWAAIAYGLQFRMEDFEDAIKEQGRVAVGLNPAGGKDDRE
ncbi:MAG TPA: hypothetical protein VFP58_00475 [Candidatus Eisenbacteria bacterium]|nr:hypothetical protein [Candidatus Eisenbacteria bacterium]